MRAIVTTPDVPGRLVSREAPAPTAAPGHALVRVRATSINRGETRLIPARPNGWAPGQDVAGVIEAPAPEGGPPAGTRVVGLADGGTWSELVAVPVERLAALPENVDFVQAACLPVAGLTALRAVRSLGDVIGRDVLVTGAAGGVGHIAVQLARAAGAFVTGLARRGLPIEDVRAVTGLDDTMRFDRVIDGVGGDVLTAALGHLRPHAKVVFYGGGAPASLGLGTMRGTPATIEALFVYLAPGRFDEDLATLVRFVSTGRLAPHVDRVVPIDRVNDALAALQAGGIAGKIVLTR
jgi:NADPH:quinone reductase